MHVDRCCAQTIGRGHRRSRCNIHMKNGKVYMKHNSLGDDVPIVVILRAMGATSDQEIVQLVSRRSPNPPYRTVYKYSTCPEYDIV